MHLKVGTSGYSYKEWKGSFYPQDLPAKDMLAYYASKLDTVEINNTFYRLPSRELLNHWRAQVPASFTFVLKASRRITHQARLKDCADTVRHLVDTAATLGDSLGPILFQLPPFLKKDAPRLTAFLDDLPKGCRAAFEFRDASWFDDEIYELLRAHAAALVLADSEDGEPLLVGTTHWGYARLRRQTYNESSLRAWAERLKSLRFAETFVFFKHEDAGAGPALALAFKALW